MTVSETMEHNMLRLMSTSHNVQYNTLCLMSASHNVQYNTLCLTQCAIQHTVPHTMRSTTHCASHNVQYNTPCLTQCTVQHTVPHTMCNTTHCASCNTTQCASAQPHRSVHYASYTYLSAAPTPQWTLPCDSSQYNTVLQPAFPPQSTVTHFVKNIKKGHKGFSTMKQYVYAWLAATLFYKHMYHNTD